MGKRRKSFLVRHIFQRKRVSLRDCGGYEAAGLEIAGDTRQPGLEIAGDTR